MRRGGGVIGYSWFGLQLNAARPATRYYPAPAGWSFVGWLIPESGRNPH